MSITQITSNLRNVILSITICILLISGGSSTFALQVTNSNFDASNYYQGDNGNISFTLYNDNSLVEWYIKTVEIQFDWMVQSNTSYQNPVNQNIVSGGSATYHVPFSIPTTTSIGSHTYTVYYIGLFNDPHVLVTGTIYIHDVNERIYYNLQQGVTNDINSAVNSGYQSPDARSDLSQAQSDFSLANSYASNGQFVNGINELQDARNLITQANSAEQSYRSSHSSFGGGSSGSSYGGSSNNNYSEYDYSGIILLAIIATAIAGSLVVIIPRIKKKGKASKTQYIKPSSSINESPISNTKSKKNEIQKDPVENTPESTKDVKDSIIEESTKKIPPKIETPDVKIVKSRKKNTKTKLEKEHDAKALSILKERLARGNISKEEYSKLKEEFE
jgi:hypothetical protein